MPSAADRRERTYFELTRRQIESAGARWMDAFLGGDRETLAELYTEDATILPPDAGLVRGRAAVLEYLGTAVPTNQRHPSQRALDVGVTGDVAYSLTRSSATEYRPKAPPLANSTRMLTVWRRQPDGAWKISASVWNSTMPTHHTPAADAATAT